MKHLNRLWMSLYFCGWAYLAHLRWWLMGLVFLGSIAYGYFVHLIHQRREARMERLEKGCFYQEQMIVSFKRNHKITAALKDTLQVCDGRLWLVVNQALTQMDNGWMKDGYMAAALRQIEAVYGSEPMESFHRFLIHVEEWGGECEEALELLMLKLRRYKTWRYCVEMHIEEQRKKLNLTVMLSGIICFSITRVLPDQFQVTDSFFYQFSMGIVLLCLWGLSLFFLFYTARQQEDFGKEKKQDYEKLWNCVQKHGHGLSYERALRILTRDVKMHFPEWLLDLLLRLQTENVSTAIGHSIEQAPEVLVIPLCRLDAEQKKDALSKEPFSNFLKELNLAEVKLIMLQLFAIRNLGKQEIKEQILSILTQEQQLDQNAQELKLEDMLSTNGLLAALPMAVSVAMMLVYMSHTLLVFLGQMANGRWI